MIKHRGFPLVLGSAAFALAIFGVINCGGGGSTPAAPLSAITGTAATGAPLLNAAITVHDSLGHVATGTTSATDGTYSIDVGALTAPYLVKVHPASGPDLYSIGSALGIVNVTPFTDLLIRSWYQVQNLDVVTVFSGANTPVPTVGQIELLADFVKKVLAQWLVQAGIDPATWDPITTAFTADGTGVDSVLDASSVTGGTVTIASGTVTQTSTVTTDNSTANVSAATTTSDSATSATSSSVVATGVPFTANGIAAIIGVQAALDAMTLVVNTKGSSVANTDVAPFFDDAYLDNGFDKATQTAEIATQFRGLTLDSLRVTNVYGYDDTNKVLDFEIQIHAHVGNSGIQEESGRFSFRKSGTSWLAYGNQQVANIFVQHAHRTFDDQSGVNVLDWINPDVRAPVGVLKTSANSVTVQGGPYSTATDVPYGGTNTETFHPTSGTNLDVVEDTFHTTDTSDPLPAAGTDYSVVVTLADSSTRTYGYTSRATTNEVISATLKDGSNAAVTSRHTAAAIAASPMTVTWTLPTTFRIVSVKLNTSWQDASNNSQQDQQILGSTATTGQVTVGSSVSGGGSTTGANISVQIKGDHGEDLSYDFQFQP